MASESIVVVGLGYVGLPLAIALADSGENVIGFDIDASRIQELEEGFDRTREIGKEKLGSSAVSYSSEPGVLKRASFIIVTVPTPIDQYTRPDLGPVVGATKTIGQHLSPGTCVVYESTVYPGVTRDICRPLLAKHSGLIAGKDFTVGYSPERVNPGDKLHTIDKIVKVVSAEDKKTLARLKAVYGKVVTAGLHSAETIEVAEAAKVIENTQRDLNIALMNELSMIFERLGIRTCDVLASARTKWNFLDFRPGLVGGHCIGVDPYYLATKSQELGLQPHLILAGREINNRMGSFVAQKLVKMLSASNAPIAHPKVGIIGISFKENVPDVRNSKVPDIVRELREFGIDPLVWDPLADADECLREYQIKLSDVREFADLDGLILAVPHESVKKEALCYARAILDRDGIFIDVKSCFRHEGVADQQGYWSV